MLSSIGLLVMVVGVMVKLVEANGVCGEGGGWRGGGDHHLGSAEKVQEKLL